MVVLIGSIGIFGVLTAIDGFHDEIPITLLNDDIGMVNKNVYSENYGEYVSLFKYPIYRFAFTGSSVLFEVTNDDRFAKYITSLESYIDYYDFGDWTLFMFQKDDGIYYLCKLDDREAYHGYFLYQAYVKVNRGADVPIAPCEYLKPGNFSNDTIGNFHSLTTLSWEEIKAYYVTYYSDHITINDDQREITLVIDSNIEYLITYSNLSIDIILVE
jgi:hypothetical protein